MLHDLSRHSPWCSSEPFYLIHSVNFDDEEVDMIPASQIEAIHTVVQSEHADRSEKDFGHVIVRKFTQTEVY